MNLFTGHSIGRWLHGAADDEEERKLDEELENSFPASDPPSHTRAPLSRGRFHALKSVWNRATRMQ